METKKPEEAWDQARNGEKDDFLSKRCPAFFDEINKRVNSDEMHPKYQQLRIYSLKVNINNFHAMKAQCEFAKEFIVSVCWTLKNMGFQIEPKKLSWRNVMDSCENITGSTGCFVLEFEFKKSEIHADFKTDFEDRMKEAQLFMKEENTKLWEMWDKYFKEKEIN